MPSFLLLLYYLGINAIIEALTRLANVFAQVSNAIFGTNKKLLQVLKRQLRQKLILPQLQKA